MKEFRVLPALCLCVSCGSHRKQDSQTPSVVEDEAPFQNTFKWSWNGGPKPRKTVLAKASSKLLLIISDFFPKQH
jgi:hypothetical protein